MRLPRFSRRHRLAASLLDIVETPPKGERRGRYILLPPLVPCHVHPRKLRVPWPFLWSPSVPSSKQLVTMTGQAEKEREGSTRVGIRIRTRVTRPFIGDRGREYPPYAKPRLVPFILCNPMRTCEARWRTNGGDGWAEVDRRSSGGCGCGCVAWTVWGGDSTGIVE